MLTLNDGRTELWQWDTGRKLTVDAECSRVHFSNKVFGRSIDVDVVDGVAIIPDVLLQTDKDLTAWAFAGTAEDGYTKIEKVFKVNRKNKPSDYVFTPTDQTTLQELAERINRLEENPSGGAVSSVNGKIGEVELSAKDVGAISQDDLQKATNEALNQAKESGEFDGAPGEKGEKGDKGDKGEKGDPGADGKDGTTPKDAVLYTEQTLTDEQKAQARKNIGVFTEFALLSNASAYPEWDTTAKTFTIPNYSRLLTASNKYIDGMNVGDIVLNLTTERGMVCYDTATGVFTVYGHDPASGSIPESSLLVATYAQYGKIVNMASAYRIDGNLYGINANGIKGNSYALIASQSGVSLRFYPAQKQLKIYANNIVGSSKNKTSPNSVITTLNNIYANGIVVYDYATATFKIMGHNQAVGDNQLLIATYTDYGNKTVSTACSYSVNDYPYGINTDKITAPRKITSPNYEHIVLPSDTPMWSDLIAIGNNILAFVQSPDEEHVGKTGRVLIYDTNFNLQKTLYHDFGHCNTCHYNANTDTLLIGNLPGSTVYPAALYIFYNVSDWLDLSEGTVLEFNALSPTIIDLSALKSVYNVGNIVQVAACWGDNNAGENNIVYVNSMYNSRWFKLVLGKGANQYAYGAYTEPDDATKFNGTFNPLEFYTCNKTLMPSEVTQGIDFYDGQIFAAEGHNGARVLKWSFDTVLPYAYDETAPFARADAATFETRLNYVYNPDGTILKVATEGIVIKDGYMYIGVFFYDNGNGSKPANSVFSNSVFKYKL